MKHPRLALHVPEFDSFLEILDPASFVGLGSYYSVFLKYRVQGIFLKDSLYELVVTLNYSLAVTYYFWPVIVPEYSFSCGMLRLSEGQGSYMIFIGLYPIYYFSFCVYRISKFYLIKKISRNIFNIN